ncbi:MAG: AbrB/MazE/SpoVT family DNA-binding domain-containing protein [Pseudomonadota bacterium]
MSERRTVKLFRNNRSQAVRIPVDFELPGDEVIMTKIGEKLIVEPAASSSLLSFLQNAESVDDDLPEIADAHPEPVEL